jgi:outer membrane lipoprotein-sorting protein
MHTTRKRAVAVAALALTSLTAGCIGGLSTGSALDADAVGERVEQRYAALDGYSATVTRTTSVGDARTETTAELTVRGDRREVTYTAGPRAGETVTSSADAGPVFAAGVSSPGSASTYGAVAESLVASSNVTVDRLTTTRGHRTAVVEFAAANASGVTRTVWVDLDRRVPLKVVTEWTTADGTNATVTVTFDDVTLAENDSSASAEVAA